MTDTVPFVKYHGTGNDFLLVEAGDAEAVTDRAAFAVTACDSVDGVGADGVLFVEEPAGSPPRVEMTLVQPDGSTAAMCGNGARCVARWAAEQTGATDVVVEAPAGDRPATVGEAVTVEMGAPSFAPVDVPLARGREDPLIAERVEGLTVTAVDTGVPHAVAVVDDVADVDVERVAPPVRHADVFPAGANVTLGSPRPDGGYDQRTYERGVEGETLACGTGAVALAAVLDRRDGAAFPLAVHPPGGRLTVGFEGDRATLRGPAVREFEGELTPAGAPVDQTATEEAR